MGLSSFFRSRLRDPRWGFGLLAVALASSVSAFLYLQRGRDLPAALVTNRVLLYFLWNLDAVLILVVLFVLARHLIKLILERHNRVLGTRFRTKLVLTYFALVLGPVLLLFLSGSNLIRMSSDRVFSTPVREVLERGNAVAQATNREIEARVERESRQALAALRDIPVGDPLERPSLDARLRTLLAQSGLDYLGVYDGPDFIHAVVEHRSGLTDLPEPGRAFVAEVMRSGSATRPAAPIGPRTRMTFAGVSDPDTGTILLGGTLIAPELALGTADLVQAYQSFRQLEVQRPELVRGALGLYLLVTLLILLGAAWLGLYMARRVTGPIQALAHATLRVSEGDLEHRVTVEAQDEFGMLVDSFNRMTDEVRKSRALLETTNDDLRDVNATLAEERARVSTVLDNIAAGVVALDGEGRVVTSNRAARRLLAQGAEALHDRRYADAWSDPDRVRLAAAVEAALAEIEADRQSRPESRPEPRLESRREPRTVQLRLGGAVRTLEVKATPLPETIAGELSTVVVFEDRTDLLQAQQSAAWTEAAKRIAHEIRNPLTPIRLAAERALARARKANVDPELGATLEESVNTITREVDSMKQMVDEFSRFARMPRPQPSEVEIGELAEEAVRLYRNLKPGVEVSSSLALEAATHAWLDREQVRRVLINLLDNALEATDAPGEVQLVARREPGRLVLEVTDTGRGVPLESRDKLFQPYFSTKGRGTGMGLAIARRIVADHGGTLRLEENRPTGSRFVIELPQ